MLHKLGYEVDVAANGREAIELLLQRPYNLVLMDCQMPEMDGFQATVAIRELESIRHVPIIALTANAIHGDREVCLNIGMDDYMAKPVKTDQLRETLERWLT